MHTWQRATSRMACGGPDDGCWVGPGEPIEVTTLPEVRTKRIRCELHAFSPRNDAALEAFDQAAEAAALQADRSGDDPQQKTVSAGSFRQAFDPKMAATGERD